MRESSFVIALTFNSIPFTFPIPFQSKTIFSSDTPLQLATAETGEVIYPPEALFQAAFICVTGAAIVIANLLIIAAYLNFRGTFEPESARCLSEKSFFSVLIRGL